jgi:hypothetical protein
MCPFLLFYIPSLLFKSVQDFLSENMVTLPVKYVVLSAWYKSFNCMLLSCALPSCEYQLQTLSVECWQYEVIKTDVGWREPSYIIVICTHHVFSTINNWRMRFPGSVWKRTNASNSYRIMIVNCRLREHFVEVFIMSRSICDYRRGLDWWMDLTGRSHAWSGTTSLPKYGTFLLGHSV